MAEQSPVVKWLAVVLLLSQGEGMTVIARSSTRILHVVGGMRRGGSETWLMHVLRHTDRKRFKMDFLVHTRSKCSYDDEIRSLGSTIIPCLCPAQPWKYAVEFKRALQKAEPYDVVHSHLYHFSGFVLRLAAQCGIPVRIAHSHTAPGSETGFLRQLYLCLMKRWIFKYATHGFACSDEAGSSLFGSSWRKDFRWDVLYCGVSGRPFQQDVDPELVRQEFGFSRGHCVIGHVGNFRKPKNHKFLLEIFCEVVKRYQNAKLLLVGEGPLREQIKDRIQELSLQGKVVMTGARNDVPRLMKGAMDVFLFPSLYEGLPIAVIEAQAAGLPTVASDHPSIREVAGHFPEIQMVSLKQKALSWSEVVMEAYDSNVNHSAKEKQKKGTKGFVQSPFQIEKSVKILETFYQSC